MSDERKNDKGGFGFGPKKPKATFGDVMLGIPSGRGGEERGGKGGGGKRPERDAGRGPRPQPSSPSVAAPVATEEGAAPAPAAEPVEARPPVRRERGGSGRKGGESKPQGPLVVVKRASGVVETRGNLEPLTGHAASADKAPTEPSVPEAVEAAAPAPAPAAPEPAPRNSALFEDVPEHQSFEEMFDASVKEGGNTGRRQVRVGEKVSGKIFQLGADTAFISLGGKSEAMIDLLQLKDDEGILRFGVGDVVEAHVIEAGAKGIILSKSLAKGSASMAMLAEARASGMPVDGLVLSVNKGGFEVAVGDTRAFCPISQMDLRFVEKPELFIGERFTFRVTEVRERNVVLSRRAILEEEQKVLATETRKNLHEGAILKGHVTGVRDFGAFVDLGGIEGMVPVSEMSHTRVGHPSEVVKVGDEVEVQVLRMEAPNPNSADKAKQKERITLSIRSRQEDPFVAAMAELKEGEKLKGKVVRLQPFGAFVELRPGVDGLIHISALSDRRIAHPRDAVQTGQEVMVLIERLDPGEKRIGLRLWNEAEDRPVGEAAPTEKGPREARAREEGVVSKPRPGQVVTGKIDRIEPYGVFVAFPGGKGLVPASETGTERGTDMKRTFQLGQELKVSVLEIDSTGKIRLSVTAAVQAEERAEVEAWTKSQPKGGGMKGFGTFADLLKGRKG